MNCYICMDNGFVVYTKSENGNKYRFVAHCTCPKGNDWQYDGRRLEEYKSEYYVKSVAEILDTYELAKANYKARNNIEMGDSYEGGIGDVEVPQESVGTA